MFQSLLTCFELIAYSRLSDIFPKSFSVSSSTGPTSIYLILIRSVDIVEDMVRSAFFEHICIDIVEGHLMLFSSALIVEGSRATPPNVEIMW